MVKLKHHPGIIELPLCHEWKQGILRDQPHGVSETRVGGQSWHIIEMAPSWKSLARKSTLPGIGSPVNMGRLILEAGES